MACLALYEAVSCHSNVLCSFLTYNSQAASVSNPVRTASAPFVLFAALRVIRAWNQTGQKHAGSPDIARHFLPAHNYLLWILVLAAYVDLIQRISRSAIPWASRRFTTAASVPLGFVALGFKIAFTNADAPELLIGFWRLVLVLLRETSLVAQARAVFLCVGFMILMTLVSPLLQVSSRRTKFRGKFAGTIWNIFANDSTLELARPLHDILSLFLVTQSRTTNIPLFLLFQIQYLALPQLNLRNIEITLTSILFQYTAFFAFGGSNAISSVDLSSAYNGVGGYNVGVVGALTFASNWAGPIWWTSASMLLMTEKQEGSDTLQDLRQHLAVMTTFVSGSVLAVMLACTTLRTHLFIWTVFSPKYLYSMAWSVGQHLCINCGFGSLMYWIGSR